MAGGASLFGQAGKRSPWLHWGDLRAADPDVVFVSPCGFDIPRTLAEMPLLAKLPGWHKLRAMREGRVIVADGNQYFTALARGSCRASRSWRRRSTLARSRHDTAAATGWPGRARKPSC